MTIIVFPHLDDYISGTDGPKLGAWTSINQFTEPEEVAAPLSKSTRHVLSSELKNTYFTPKLNNKASSQRGDVDFNEINSGKLRGMVVVN